MTYAVISATYANDDGTAVTVMTAEAGAVSISERDRPELWAQLAGLVIAPFVPDAPPAAPPADVGTEQTVGPNVLA